MAKVGTSRKIWMVFQGQQYRIWVPIRTVAFPMVVDGHFYAKNTRQAIHHVQLMNSGFGSYVFDLELFGQLKVFFPFRFCIAPNDIDGLHDKAILSN